MKKFIKYIYLGLVIFTYSKGALIYEAKDSGYAAGWALLCAVSVFLLWGRLKNDFYFSTKLTKIDKMSGEQFEKYLAEQFKRLGYHVSFTERSHDYGADLILKKRKKVIVVQAKRYEKNIGIKAVQEIVGAVAYYQAEEAMVVTNRYYTKSAIKLAKQNGVILWTRDNLKNDLGAK